MSRITIEKQVAAPPEQVFEHATNLREAAGFIRGIQAIEVLTDGAVGMGTRFRETRIMFKREATQEMEITAFDPPRSYSVDAENCGCRYHSVFSFEPKDGGTLMRWEFETIPLTLIAKVMALVFSLMMKAMRKEMEKDLDDVKAVAEGGPLAGS